MKRQILTLAMAAMTAIGVWAAPALPGVWQVKQADGTMLTVEQFGDEYHHWTATADGVLVINTGKGYYVAEIDTEGRLAPTQILAHEAGLRTAAEVQAVSRQAAQQAVFHERGLKEARAARRSPSISTTAGYVPHTGSPRILIILAAYSDLDFIVNEPVQAFEQFFNGDTQADLGNANPLNLGSVRQYFETSSRGQFVPQFDVVGPVTLPGAMADYGSGNSNNEKMSLLSNDAINLVKETVDFSLYDNDGDGRAELVFIVHAGYGQNQGGPVEAMWAKMSTQNIKVSDDVTVTRVGCCAELFNPSKGENYDYSQYINGTGVFCHEFSHALGLPDLYPTNTEGRRYNNQGLEYWDLMDGGLYTRNGFAPMSYNAWEQAAMGWTTLEPLTEPQTGLTMLPLIEEGGKAYMIPNPDDDNEFIVVENIQQRSLNAFAYGHGLLACHVAYPRSAVNMGDSPNNTGGKPSVAVVPADGLLISTYQREGAGYDGTYTSAEYRTSLAGDPFPGSQGVTELTVAQGLPNYQFYNGDHSLVGGLRNISEDTETGVVTFDFVSDTTTGIKNVERGTWNVENVYDLSGRRINAQPVQPAKGLYISNGKKYVR